MNMKLVFWLFHKEGCAALIHCILYSQFTQILDVCALNCIELTALGKNDRDTW